VHTRHGVEDLQFQKLLGGLNLSVVPRLMAALGLPPRTPLPMYWSVDFIPASSGRACQILLATS